MSDVERRAERRFVRQLILLLIVAAFFGFMSGYCTRDAVLLEGVREEGKP